MLDFRLIFLPTQSLILTAVLQDDSKYSHFVDGKTEAYIGLVTVSQATQLVTSPEFSHRCDASKAKVSGEMKQQPE